MTKKIFYAVLAVISLACGMSSCSKDDKNDGPDGPYEPTREMVLIKMVDKEQGMSGGRGFTAEYDSEGRIIEWVDLRKKNSTVEYTYSDSEIIAYDVDRASETKYVVENGRIVKSNTTQYTYDSANRLKKILDDYDEPFTLYWGVGDNITASSFKKDDGTTVEQTMSYSDKPNVGNLNYALNAILSVPLYPAEAENIPYPLAMSGFSGKIGNNLCKGIQLVNGFYWDIEYTDYNKYGYPETIKIRQNGNSRKDQYSLTWMEL